MGIPALRSSPAATSNSKGPKQMPGGVGGFVDTNLQESLTALILPASLQAK